MLLKKVTKTSILRLMFISTILLYLIVMNFLEVFASKDKTPGQQFLSFFVLTFFIRVLRE